MKITAHDITQLGIIDDVISEPLYSTHKDIEQQALAIKSAFVEQLDSLESLSRDEIANDRFEKIQKYRFLYRIISLSIFMLNRYWVLP